MTSAYVTALTRQSLSATENPPAASDLRQRFLHWYESLPPISRDRPFAMNEMEQALGTQGKYLSPILLNLGWQRKRRWTGGGQYSRYWVPACN